MERNTNMGDRRDLPVTILGKKMSPNCLKIQWALDLKGVEYEFLEEDLSNKSELLLKSNPVHKKVHVLLHGETAVAESLVILEYIDEVWNEETRPRLLPTDPYERAQARFWAKFLDEKVVVGALDACKAEGEEQEKATEATIEMLALVEKQVEGRKFFGGEQIGFLDLVAGRFGLFVGVLEEVGGMKLLDPKRFPSLHEWVQKFPETPLIKETRPPREELVSYVRRLRSLATKIHKRIISRPLRMYEV